MLNTNQYYAKSRKCKLFIFAFLRLSCRIHFSISVFLNRYTMDTHKKNPLFRVDDECDE